MTQTPEPSKKARLGWLTTAGAAFLPLVFVLLADFKATLHGPTLVESEVLLPLLSEPYLQIPVHRMECLGIAGGWAVLFLLGSRITPRKPTRRVAWFAIGGSVVAILLIHWALVLPAQKFAEAMGR